MQDYDFYTDPSHPFTPDFSAWLQTIDPMDLTIHPLGTTTEPRSMADFTSDHQATADLVPMVSGPAVSSIPSTAGTHISLGSTVARVENSSLHDGLMQSAGAVRPSASALFPPSNAYLPCNYPQCQHKTWSSFRRREHFKAVHPCTDCGFEARDLGSLDFHAQSEGHNPYICAFEGCASRFSRSDSLDRHAATHSKTSPRYECPHCYRHNGEKAFKRRDHLTQHLRSYHHIGEDTVRSKASSCPHLKCAEYRIGVYDMIGSPILTSGWPLRSMVADEDHAFKTRKAFQDHMRKVHHETPFQCFASGCDRRGVRGWFRETDLKKHQRKEHGGEALRAEVPKWHSG